MNEPRPSPQGAEEDRLSFSLSEDEAEDTADSLDIKPPQAVVHRKPTRHKKDKVSSREVKYTYKKSHHSRPDERRKEYRADRSQRKREMYPKESQRRSDHRDKKERERDRDHRLKKEVTVYKEERIVTEKRSHKEPNHNDQILDDLRGKLLEKKMMRDVKIEIEHEPERKRLKKDKRDKADKERKEEVNVVETEKERDERLQREERKAKLLEAEREMAMRKEVSRRELEARRERHNIEKEKHRMLKEIARKHKLEKDGQEKSEGEEGEIEEKSEDNEEEEEDDDDDDDEDEDDDSDSSSSSSSDDSTGKEETDNEAKAGTPESAPPLEKSPRTPAGHPPSLGSSREATPEPKKAESEEPMDTSGDYHGNESPKSDVEVKDSLPPYLPAIQGCRSVEEFQCLNRIEEGTYGVVYRARDKRTSDIVALKRLKMEKEKEGFPITSLREINTLLKAQHPNIVTVREIVVGSNMDKIFIVMDYVEHDLKSLMETMKAKKQVFVPGEIKCLMIQLLQAVRHLHDNWILHRDLKTSNLLLSHKGILKVGDFGLAREYGSPLKAYTPIVVTLWYRAPELLLQTKEYTTAIDIWSVGCIFAELLQMEALFPGRSEMEQLNRIFKELGTPNEKLWPGCGKLPAFQKVTFADYPVNRIRNRFGNMLSELGIKLLNSFLTYDPTQRIVAEDALKHDYFKEVPLPIDTAMFPTWPAKSEKGVEKEGRNSPKPPSGGKEYKQLGDTDEELQSGGGGFHMAAERRANVLGPGFSLKF